MIIKLSTILSLLLVFLLSGCSPTGSSNDPSAYLKTFDNIYTNQYIETYGQGGIYWVSNDHVVLEAQIVNEQGSLDRGLYQVDVRDGSYLRVVDINDEGPFNYKFCFDGNVLHVMTKRGEFRQMSKPTQGYGVVVRPMDQNNRARRYNPFRCKSLDVPLQGRGINALRKGDGFIKYVIDEGEVSAFLGDETGKIIKKLVQQKVAIRGSPVGLFTVERFVEDKNAYFGYSSWDSSSCTQLWWLHRQGWELESQQFCAGEWAHGSVSLHVLKDALYIENHNRINGEPKSFIINKNIEQIPVDVEDIWGASVSPSGCKVAYGVDDETSSAPQKLRLFNYCEFQEKRLKL